VQEIFSREERQARLLKKDGGIMGSEASIPFANKTEPFEITASSAFLAIG